MSQQAFNLALNIKDLLYDNWTLEDQLEKTKFTWFSYEPTRNEIREKPFVIGVTFQSGQGDPTCKAVSQMKDLIKIDIYVALRNLEGEKTRITAENNRMLVKDMILGIIHDNQTAITGLKFGKYIRSARTDEVESTNEQWYLHEVMFLQGEWYHTSS